MVEWIIISLISLTAWSLIVTVLSGGEVWKDKDTFIAYVVYTAIVALVLYIGSDGQFFKIKS